MVIRQSYGAKPDSTARMVMPMARMVMPMARMRVIADSIEKAVTSVAPSDVASGCIEAAAAAAARLAAVARPIAMLWTR